MALAGYDRVRALDPGYAQALQKSGKALAVANRVREAIGCFDRALKINPDDVMLLYNRAAGLRRLRRSGEALADLDRALALKPDFAEALISRAKVLRMGGEIAPALACFREAMRLRPDDPELHSTYIFSLNFDPSASEADKQRERADWDRRHAQKFNSRQGPHDNDPSPERRLRIGYASSYFRNDNAAYGFGNAILRHDPAQFEVICYSDTEHEDDATDSLR
ncbi:MAG: tetratricopeptide repeat protein, partial [Bryobacteraceae bacterium]